MNYEHIKGFLDNLKTNEEIILKYLSGESLILTKNKEKAKKMSKGVYVGDCGGIDNTIFFPDQKMCIDTKNVYFCKVRKNEDERIKHKINS